jgi:1-acyl-sn-glycerol-3-phosphate acyltransferase
MKRYSKEALEKHPHLRGKDIEATRKACAKYRELPVSVMNFVEGTRFTPAKHARQGAPHADLLLPRAGGIAFVLDAMGELLNAVVDVTLAYPQGRPSMIDLFTGRVREVHVEVRALDIPPDLLGGDYSNDAAFRERFQAWLNAIWGAKADRLEALLRRA